MKKRTALLFTILLLAGCGSSEPVHLLHTNQPILNIEADAHAVADAQVFEQHAWVKNKTANPIHLSYQLFWYNKQGVSQASVEQERHLMLSPYETYRIPLHKPTAESQQYRLYVRLR